ncbi:MAG TPA: glycine cleavage T C-terminal barrel domain-containing protein [Vicinamibacterales bacterium]|nr:glycine cleavage T C-terminal barrel domain-containing protein [Vicinamibacterales bacterium]
MRQDNSSGYRALVQGAGLVDPVWTGRLLLTGADRRAYLQGLLTNDIDALSSGTGCYAAMLNAQGRMLTDMHVFELGNAVLLTLPAAVTHAIRVHLDRFIFSEDVHVQDATESLAQIGVYGPLAREAIAGVTIDAPSLVIIPNDEPGIDGFDVFADRALAAGVRERLVKAAAVPVTSADVETVRIERGRPRWGADMDTDTIPLEAGIEDRAISRTKGCYVGQEVIVRVIDRGHGRVARRLVGLTFDPAATVPIAGAHIASGERDIGRVTSAVWSPALSRPIALGYVQRDFVDPETPVTIDGVTGQVAQLPFV